MTVDVQTTNGGEPYVEVAAPSIEHPELDGRLARTLVIENAELVLGRFTHAGGQVHVEHAILAGTTMAAVEVQASVWTVAWAADAFAHRLEALLREASPTPAAPQTPAALRRDAEAHVVITDHRVKHFLDEQFGGFDHDPNWGYHGGFGSARVFVDVLPVLEDSTAVRASSPVLSDIDLTDDLALELMRLAAESPFGCYSYQPAAARGLVRARDLGRRPRPAGAGGGHPGGGQHGRRAGRHAGRAVRRTPLRRPVERVGLVDSRAE